jgi:hypothetical protein
VNDAIYKQPLVLFLGAGASQPLGLKTSVQFCEWLKSDEEIAPFIEAAESYYKEEDTGVQIIDAEALLDFLEDLAKADKLLLKYEKEFHNLRERFRHELALYARERPRDYKAEPSMLSVGEKEKICNRIKDLVIRHYSKIEEVETIQLYSPLLSKLTESRPLPIFTTNYDLAIEKLGESGIIELIDGFNRWKYRKPRWARGEYDFYDTSRSGANVILFKLHGSVDWLRTTEGIQMVDIPAKDPGGMQTLIAYPSRLKREIHEEPYRTNYDYLLACLLYAKVCAVIGFSFRDQEIVEEFRQAMELNEDLELIIIDPEAEAVKTDLENKVGFESYRVDSVPGYKSTIKTKAEEFTPQNAASIAEFIEATLLGHDTL